MATAGVHSIPFVGLARQHQALATELGEAFRRVVSSNSFVLGEEVDAFEGEWANYCETEFAVGVASGTAALHLTLLALGVGPGDEVIAPAHTFVASVLPILYVGARPVLVDCDASTGTIDVEEAAGAISARTRALIAVHLYGQAADIAELASLADERGFALIEDACQAHGARYRDRPGGSLGRAGCFSFYPTKNLGAFGDGGAVVTGDPELAERLRSLRDLGQRKKYEHLIVGFNERLDALQAALLRVKLARLDEWNEARRAAAAAYDDLLSGLPIRRPKVAATSEHVWHLYVIRADDRDRLRGELTEAGIETGLHYPLPVHLQPPLHGLGYETGSFPHAEEWSASGLSLPMFPELTLEEIEVVADALVRALT